MDNIIVTTVSTITSTIIYGITIEAFHSNYLWVVIVGFILAFTLGAGMGANDVSNAFGTSVGSKVLTIKQAYVLATIFESLGAILLGYNVADTMRKGVVDIGLYEDNPKALMLGQIAILGAGTCWLAIATKFKLPVSTTHSIVGATLGFSIMLKGFNGIQWKKVIAIAASWVISPVFSGVVSMIMYLLLDFAVLRRSDPFKYGFFLLPFFFFFVIFMNSIAVLMSGSKILGLSGLPVYASLSASFGIALVAALLIQFVLKPWLKKWVNKKHEKEIQMKQGDNITVVISNNQIHPTNDTITPTDSMDSSNDSNKTQNEAKINARLQKFELSWKGFWNWLIPHQHRKEDAKTIHMFSSLQVFTACFAGFAHGANDVSNAIAPITALMSIYGDLNVYQTTPTPIYLLLFGTGSVCIGLWVFGHRVIKTIGDDVTEVNPANGFIIEFGAATTAMIASKLGLPISTTHALVGSVVGVGMVKTGAGVDWKVFGSIASSWIITLPASAAISAVIMFLLEFAM